VSNTFDKESGRGAGKRAPKVLILGANGQIARVATELFLAHTNAHLTLYLRKAKRLKLPGNADRVRIIEGNVLDQKQLESVMTGQDVVYGNLAGQLEQQAECIVQAMNKAGVKRLIFISSMGIYGEVPGERHGSIFDPYRISGKRYRSLRPRLHNSAARLAR
jgi:nucleoside-diphosphate-sugar epimerase